MRAIALAILLPVLAICHAIDRDAQPRELSSTSITTSASPASIPSSSIPAATQILDDSVLENLGLRQVAAAPAVPANPAAPNVAAPPVNPAAPANPVAPPAVNPAAPANPIVPPAVNPAAPAVPSITAAPAPDPTREQISTTVQWVETWVGGTSQTWVPVTITMRFGVVMSQAPQPGKGAVGMGTLKGEVGVTKTVVLGAAPTMGAEWKRGLAAAVGVGLVGLVA